WSCCPGPSTARPEATKRERRSQRDTFSSFGALQDKCPHATVPNPVLGPLSAQFMPTGAFRHGWAGMLATLAASDFFQKGKKVSCGAPPGELSSSVHVTLASLAPDWLGESPWQSSTAICVSPSRPALPTFT